jgi:hypothetical protein
MYCLPLPPLLPVDTRHKNLYHVWKYSQNSDENKHFTQKLYIAITVLEVS